MYGLRSFVVTPAPSKLGFAGSAFKPTSECSKVMSQITEEYFVLIGRTKDLSRRKFLVDVEVGVIERISWPFLM